MNGKWHSGCEIVASLTALGLLAFCTASSHRPTGACGKVATMPSGPSGRSCGPEALVAAAAHLNPSAMARLSATLLRDQRAHEPVCTLADLAEWARRAGLRPSGLRLPTKALRKLATPYVAHLTGDHFVAVLTFADDDVLVADDAGRRWIPASALQSLASGRVLTLTIEAMDGDQGATR